MSNASTATNTSTYQNPPNWCDASISELPEIWYNREETWNLLWRKEDLKLTKVGRPNIYYDGEGA